MTRRQTPANCLSGCTQWETQTSSCSSYLNSLDYTGYGNCMCTGSILDVLAGCINCGLTSSTTESQIQTLENAVNTYISACASLGHTVSLPSITAHLSSSLTFCYSSGSSNPTSSLAFTIPNTNTGSSTSAPTSTGIIPTATSTNPFGIDDSQLSLISDLLSGFAPTVTVTQTSG
ncbi:hypothetical protein CPB86DRAFT_81119 [Serendipita vermifera]|nr:hypothetical protein CPB86DRAFT_81119 [Serendipita vermifera]